MNRFALLLVVGVACFSGVCCGRQIVGFGGEDSGADGVSFADTGSLDGFDVEPSTEQDITVAIGQSTPTVSFNATQDGAPVNAKWTVEEGALGSVGKGPSSTGVFAPSGAVGGIVNVTASYGSQSVTRQVFVKLSGAQSGNCPPSQIATSVAALSTGGGVGGVGGEGCGVGPTDPATLAALANPSTNGSAQNLAFIYPYDKTVWPRGMLAPNLQWSWTPNNADAIKIDLTTSSGSFTWSGTFAAPAILSQTSGSFIRHPIPEDIWEMATNSAGGVIHQQRDHLTVALTVAKNGVAYGPIHQTWDVAPALLTGTVYYNSYATAFVKNIAATDAVGHPYGAAILGIRSGETAPHLVIGKNSPLNGQGIPTDDSGCRVCHVVAAQGRWMLSQSDLTSDPSANQVSFLYDLKAPNVQASGVQVSPAGVFSWAGMVGDGSYAVTNSIDPSSTNHAITNSLQGSATSSFWQLGATPQTATMSGLPNGVAVGYPSFSPDDKMFAYIDATGSTQNVKGPLNVADYDSVTHTFSNGRTLDTPTTGQRIGYPVFSPDDSGLLFETQLRSSQGDSVIVTRFGARSELWWVNLNGTPTPIRLSALNGKNGTTSYLPVGSQNHGIAGAYDPSSAYDETGLDDTTLNYEGTILPVAAGGYAWVVFTSRRLYGNVLTSVPWNSYPAFYDVTDPAKATVKKLWVAAIDLNAPPGTDPSHPAFYLPGQELLAGNSRGFWVLDPCHSDGGSCTSGDQCCGGYCESSEDGGLVCGSSKPTCGGEGDKCSAGADCCSGKCVGGYCDVPTPPN